MQSNASDVDKRISYCTQLVEEKNLNIQVPPIKDCQISISCRYYKMNCKHYNWNYYRQMNA